ncbi:transposase, partial [Xanthomonas oryzae]|uniref:transposase n=1 Tax=Xanthomonas oryzae TaxID=347 RepID=UPI00211701E7
MTFRTQAGDFALVGTGRHIGVLAIEAVGTDRRADAISFDIADANMTTYPVQALSNMSVVQPACYTMALVGYSYPYALGTGVTRASPAPEMRTGGFYFLISPIPQPLVAGSATLRLDNDPSSRQRRWEMGINLVQFQPGLSLSEFMDRYGTEAKCYRALYRWRWPKGFRCPQCDGRARSRFRRADQVYYQCRACRHQTTLRAGTLLQSSKLSLRLWMQAMYLLTSSKTNLAALELKRHLGVT